MKLPFAHADACVSRYRRPFSQPTGRFGRRPRCRSAIPAKAGFSAAGLQRIGPASSPTRSRVIAFPGAVVADRGAEGPARLLQGDGPPGQGGERCRWKTDSIFQLASMTKPMVRRRRADAVRRKDGLPLKSPPLRILPGVSQFAGRRRRRVPARSGTSPARNPIFIQDLMRHSSVSRMAGRRQYRRCTSCGPASSSTVAYAYNAAGDEWKRIAQAAAALPARHERGDYGPVDRRASGAVGREGDR